MSTYTLTKKAISTTATANKERTRHSNDTQLKVKSNQYTINHCTHVYINVSEKEREERERERSCQQARDLYSLLSYLFNTQ